MANKKHTISEETEKTEDIGTIEVYVTYEMRQSIDVLIQGVEMGQKAGIYSFQDSTLIGQAINVLNDYRIK